jgi:hypothetical protein
MEHVVFFPAHDGTPAFRRVANLEDAVRLVEHLRNVEGVSEVSVHALAEVPLAFKTWYRVEVPVSQDAPAPEHDSSEELSTELAPVPVLVEDAPLVDVPEQPMAALASSNGSVSDGPSSLGFFAS